MKLVELLDLTSFLTLALIFIPLERLLPLHREQKVLRRGWANDLLYVFVNRFLVQAGLVLVVATLGIGLRMVVPEGVREFVSSQPLWLQLIAALLVADVGFYAAHRMFHSVPWLWRYHAVHHSIEEMDWLAGARVHPIDQVVTKGAAILPLYVLGFSGEAMGIYAAIYYWQSALVHANLRVNFGPLKWLLATPEFHHWHHANQREAWDKNFAGQLPFLDALFGTMYMPQGRMPERYGVDDPVPETYVEQLFYPFRRRRKAAPIAREPEVQAEQSSA
jgi:sterol desaturase/sphingolipid hydroxylase (fatty acid hydroxylase superfamily)